MQSGGRLIEDIKSVVASGARQFGSQFNPLRFASRKRCRWLPESQVPESHLLEILECSLDWRKIFKEINGRFDLQIQDISNRKIPILYFQSLPIESTPLAITTGDMQIGKKRHVYFTLSLALTGFAAAPFDIKAESSGSKPPRSGSFCASEHLANFVKDSGVGCRIATRGATDG